MSMRRGDRVLFSTTDLPIYNYQGAFVKWYEPEADEVATVSSCILWQDEMEDYFGPKPYRGEDRVVLTLKSGETVITYASHLKNLTEDCLG